MCVMTANIRSIMMMMMDLSLFHLNYYWKCASKAGGTGGVYMLSNAVVLLRFIISNIIQMPVKYYACSTLSGASSVNK